MAIRIKCTRCGNISRGRMPRGGDGSCRFPIKHLHKGVTCMGSYEEGEWMEGTEAEQAKAQAAAIIKQAKATRREIAKWRKRNAPDSEIAVALGIPTDSPLFLQP